MSTREEEEMGDGDLQTEREVVDHVEQDKSIDDNNVVAPVASKKGDHRNGEDKKLGVLASGMNVRHSQILQGADEGAFEDYNDDANEENDILFLQVTPTSSIDVHPVRLAIMISDSHVLVM